MWSVVRFLVLPLVLLAPLPARGLDARALIEDAVVLIDRGQPSLARAYLEPALIAPALHNSERSRAYYLRGYSFSEQQLYVSARLDYNRALEFNPDNPGALVALGRLHLAGQGITPDARLAFLLFEKAAGFGHQEGKVLAGRALLLGEGVARDLARARQWLSEAAADGDAIAMLHMGLSYRAPYLTPPDINTAREWYEKARLAGSPEALVILGHMQAAGEMGAVDHSAAFELFKAAADQGLADGQVRVAHAYLRGVGVAANPELARVWFEKAAQQGSVDAWVGLGYLNQAGIAMSPDLDKAKVLYRKAALAGNVQGIARYIQLLLALGEQVAHEEAARWLARLAREKRGGAANDYAWLLATSPHAAVRDGELAVQFASQSVAAEASASHLDTLAAAYAEAGQFADAVVTQEKALGLLDVKADAFRPEMEQRLKTYRAGKPWRE